MDFLHETWIQLIFRPQCLCFNYEAKSSGKTGSILESGPRHCFLYDRGLLTGSAYIEDLKTKTNIALFENKVIVPVRYGGLEDVRSRVPGVIHMVTAAIGAEHAYTTDDNLARLTSRASKSS
ncbi:MAG: hypothetical protein R3B55_01865 [Candidatus Paceibacterota bacterium]